VTIPPDILSLEREDTLGDAFIAMRYLWQQGNRDRELGLHLMFLAWYINLEPEHLTGRDRARLPDNDLLGSFDAVYSYFAPYIDRDAEMLYVVGLMANLASWCLGNMDAWEHRSRQFRIAYRRLAPEGIPPATFSGRGYFGEYFAGQAGVRDGY
jgi:hypothetical protein